MTLIDTARQLGIVGAGGAGFPTYVKLSAPADTVILNAAECEPLLHKDKELLKAFPDEIVRGLDEVREAVGADRACIGIKEKYEDVIELLQPRLPEKMSIFRLGDFYPAGDEFILVYDVTGRVIPTRKLPKDVGCLVQNVETILNLAQRQPLTHKYLTVAGAVAAPVTVDVPVGSSVQYALDLAGGATVEDPVVISGGVMMGKLIKDLSTPITKTTGGLIVVNRDHAVARRYLQDFPTINTIGRSACDQCSFCTEMCPRYLLGHAIEPHKAMRTLGFVAEPFQYMVGTEFCCECNLCTMYACPEDLDPKNVCVQGKHAIREADQRWEGVDRKPHAAASGRRIPVSSLIRKLGLRKFENTGPLLPRATDMQQVTIPLQMHIGAPARSVVRAGERVTEGQMVADVDEKQLGCPIHASIAGIVESVNGAVVIRRG